MKKEHFQTHSTKLALLWYQNQINILLKKRKLHTISLMNIHSKFLHRISKLIQQYSKKIIYHDQLRFSQGCQDGSRSINQSMWYITLKMKDKSHMITSEKSLDKGQQTFTIETFNLVSLERTYIKIIRLYVTHTQLIYTQWWKAESLSSKIRNKTRTPTITTSIQHSIRSPRHNNQIRKKNKRIKIGKEDL